MGNDRKDGNNRKKVANAKGRPWPKYVVKAAEKLLRETSSITATRKGLEDLFDFANGPPARSTLQVWARKRGIAVDVDAGKTRDTTKATEARLERLEQGRAELSERLLEKLTGPAVEQIATRLQEAQEAEGLVAAARQAYQDSLKMIATTKDVMADEDPAAVRAAVKEAMKVVAQARRELAFALDFRIDVRDLVGIVTRALGDHLALEGLDQDEDLTRGDLIVEHVIPRPDRRKADAEAVPQAKLRVIPGGGAS